MIDRHILEAMSQKKIELHILRINQSVFVTSLTDGLNLEELKFRVNKYHWNLNKMYQETLEFLDTDSQDLKLVLPCYEWNLGLVWGSQYL